MKKKIIQGTSIHIIDEEDLASVLNKEFIESKDSTNYKCLYTEIVEFKKVSTWYEVSIFSIHMEK